jgi:hypothetical protein
VSRPRRRSHPRLTLAAKIRDRDWIAVRWRVPAELRPLLPSQLCLRLVDLNPVDPLATALVLQEWLVPTDRGEWFLAAPAVERVYQVRLGCLDAQAGWQEWARSSRLRCLVPAPHRLLVPVRKREPCHPRQRLWLFADAKLMVHGATMRHAQLVISGQPVQVEIDGTFCFDVPLREGVDRFSLVAQPGLGPGPAISRSGWIRKETRLG